MSVADLPDAALVSIAAYLPKTSVGFFAAAMPSALIAKAVISSLKSWQWETIDFMDIDWQLQMKIRDDDLAGLLRSIDAANSVKHLKLTHLSAVTGRGLEEDLRTSSVLERLDLSLVEQHEPPDKPFFILGDNDVVPLLLEEIVLSEEIVLPLLGSMIDQPSCSLRHLQFPHKWSSGKSEAFRQFILKYNSFLRNLNIPCGLGCGRSCHSAMSGDCIQGISCYICVKNVCVLCTQYSGEGLLICNQKCKKFYCRECTNITKCDNCSNQVCKGCNVKKWDPNQRESLVRKCGNLTCFRKFCIQCKSVDDFLGCSRFMCGECEDLI
ncbi:hypothetical protein ACHAXR_008072 [Thalassiosira sp. AJA248-18]